jgi:hypothetical protein
MLTYYHISKALWLVTVAVVAFMAAAVWAWWDQRTPRR